MLSLRRLSLGAGAIAAVAIVFLLVAAPSPPQDEPEYVGSDLCAECHVDQWERFEGTYHDDILAYADDAEVGIGGCEACHGPGSLHVELAGAEEPAFRAAINASPDPTACWNCHTDVRGQFSLPERHPVMQGFMGCADCHDPHGSSNDKFLVGAGNQTCSNCHMDKEGPWVFPHPVAEVDGCVACHQPHGSTNPHLLPYKEIQYVCLSCHTVQPSFHDQPRRAHCTACHSQIHGSNVDPYFLE